MEGQVPPTFVLPEMAIRLTAFSNTTLHKVFDLFQAKDFLGKETESNG